MGKLTWASFKLWLHQMYHLRPGGETWRGKAHCSVEVSELGRTVSLFCTCRKFFYPIEGQMPPVHLVCPGCQKVNTLYVLVPEPGRHGLECACGRHLTIVLGEHFFDRVKSQSNHPTSGDCGEGRKEASCTQAPVQTK